MLGKFNSLGNARNFSARTIKMSAIVLGDDGKFWVVTMATMERMIRGGYTISK